jgi:mRNA interferase MazF
MQTNLRRGEIYWVDWSPSRGREQSGIRPALIIQNDIGNKYSPNTIVASITTAIPKGSNYPFLVICSTKDSGLDRQSAIDLASIMTISKARIGDRCGELTPAKMLEVDEAVKNSLGLAK